MVRGVCGWMLLCGLPVIPALFSGCSRERAEPVVMIAGASPERGRAAVREYGCVACHTIPGVRGANGVVGPPLNRIANRVYIAGTLPNTPQNLIRWIQNPLAINPGTAMPDTGVTSSDAQDIASFLYTLSE